MQKLVDRLVFIKPTYVNYSFRISKIDKMRFLLRNLIKYPLSLSSLTMNSSMQKIFY